MAVTPVELGSSARAELHPRAAAGSRATLAGLGADTTGTLSGYRNSLLAMGTDAMSAVLAVVASCVVVGFGGSALVELGLFVPLILAAMSCYGMYRNSYRRLVGSSFPDLSKMLHSALLAALGAIVIRDIIGHGVARPSDLAFSLAAVSCVALLPACRMLARSALSRRHTSRILLVGSGVVAASVLSRLTASPGLTVVGCVDDDAGEERDPSVFGIKRLGLIDDIPQIVSDKEIDHVVVAFSPVSEYRLVGALRSISDAVRISVVPRMFDLLTVRSRVDDLAGLAVVDVAPASLGRLDRTAKRTLDIIVSAAALVVLAPVLLAIGISVRLTSSGPALFVQVRSGRNLQPFGILKFRTMHQDAETRRAQLLRDNDVDGPLFKLRRDPRITPLGRFLRKTSLDELPQLVNVLLGHMSLVGPRPFITGEATSIDGWAARRYMVRPGITGLWQISGRNDLPYEELRRLDYAYVASWSLWWDLRILWHTPASVLRRRGAY